MALSQSKGFGAPIFCNSSLKAKHEITLNCIVFYIQFLNNTQFRGASVGAKLFGGP